MKYLGYAWCAVTALALLAALIVGLHNLWDRYQRRREINRSVSDFRQKLETLGDITGEAI